MNSICDFCTMQEHGTGLDGDIVRCGKAKYTDNIYRPYKHGCKCIYDDDLELLFLPRPGAENSISDMAINFKKQEYDLSKMQDENRELKRRLTAINE